ncbi:GntR family transcriptional regulator [Methylobacterium nodulans]|uniref:Transcriptional regulator, GntR family n=1 Tax=Methylobacterium nodulans (strain LMG 21967 / CNCM I-2342 / ORS 2060) TaxID=460265 RepID=B8IIJ6_METNO|nr:GntR family transcriptional regulator [Methylobacterium nodulans]ACL59873.1 transcriptional regulator, GntR family [Methylobacterium nodulans ORS 2060]
MSARNDMAGHKHNDRDEETGVYLKIKKDVVYNQFAPRSQLKLKELSDKYGFGDTPVRDALIKLATEGLIEYIPYKGYFTKPMTVLRFTQHYDAALVLLKYAIQSGPSSFTTEEPCPSYLFGEPAPTGEAETTPSHARDIESLYGRIAAMSENSEVMSLIGRFIDHTRYIRELGLEQTEGRGTIVEGMICLVKLLAAGDRTAAIEILTVLFDQKIALLAESVKEGNNRALGAVRS